MSCMVGGTTGWRIHQKYTTHIHPEPGVYFLLLFLLLLNLNIEMNIGWVGRGGRGAPVGKGMGERFDQSLHKCVCAGDKRRSPPAVSQRVFSDTLLIRRRLE